MDYTPRERIGSGTKMTMMFVAIFFWLGSFIPIINWGMVPAGWLTFGFWFYITGGNLIKSPGSKGFASSLILRILSFVIGFLPVIGTILSAFPLVIYTNIKRIQKEDKEWDAKNSKR